MRTLVFLAILLLVPGPDIVDAADLPRVVLLGDSIRLGYAPLVARLRDAGHASLLFATTTPIDAERQARPCVAFDRVLQEKLAHVYRAVGAGERFRNVLYPGVGHTVTPEMRRETLAWFARWLKEPPASSD